MTNVIRIVDTGLRDAQWNVAMTAALVELHATGKIGDVIRFHRYWPCVLLGRNQSADAVADIEYCAHNGIELVQRVTGGGAVFMSPKMLAWDVVVDRGKRGGHLSMVADRICSAIAEALAGLGFDAQFRAPNDVEIGGRKVSGSSGYTEGRSIVLQGTVLIDDDAKTMARALRIPDDALKNRVTCLRETAAGDVAADVVVQRITSALCAALGKTAAEMHLDAAEHERCEQILREAEARPGVRIRLVS